MTQTELPPMAPGGEWLSDGSHRGPIYVHHEAHVKRLIAEGWRPTEDPRKPAEKPAPVVDREKADMQARINKLEAALQQLLDEKANADSTPNDDIVDPDGKENDSRPGGTEPAVQRSRNPRSAG